MSNNFLCISRHSQKRNFIDFDVPYQILLIRLLLDASDWQTAKPDGALGYENVIT